LSWQQHALQQPHLWLLFLPLRAAFVDAVLFVSGKSSFAVTKN